MNESIPIACDLTVFSPEVREQHAATVGEMFQRTQQVKELPDGYAFLFPNEPGMFMALATFVEHERQCCPFYHFTLEVEPGGGPLWMHLAGSQEAKKFMEAAWVDLQAAERNGMINTGGDEGWHEAIDRASTPLAEVMAKAVPLTPDDV